MEVEADEMVTMEHPEVDGTATATRKALDEVWSDLGWHEASPQVEGTPDVSQLTKAELNEYARGRGIETEGLTKGEILQRLDQSTIEGGQ